MTDDRVIGYRGSIPWNISADLKLFQKITWGQSVIMGRKTRDSLGKPLKERINIVLSETVPPGKKNGFIFCSSFDDCIDQAKSTGREIFIIGGECLYRLGLPVSERLLISRIPGKYPGDAFFPEIDPAVWNLTQEERKEGFLFQIFDRTGRKA